MKIGYLYYNFYPVTGGASVHGYYLARELSALGFKLYKLNGEADPFTRKYKNSIIGAYKILRHCDVIYARIDYFVNLRNLLMVVSLFVGKRVVVEMNSPSDELRLFGKSDRYIRWTDRIAGMFLRRAKKVIVVSEAVKKYCVEALSLKRVQVIENGGERFSGSPRKVAPDTIEKMRQICTKWPKRMVWAGSLNKMQNISVIQKIAKECSENLAVIMIVNTEDDTELPDLSCDNIYLFQDLDRRDIEYILPQCHAGLALYGDYSWSRWGFYNSSLKIFEYLANGLLTITNKRGTDTQQSYSNYREIKDTDEIITLVKNMSPQTVEPSQNGRTWKHVAAETAKILKKADK